MSSRTTTRLVAAVAAALLLAAPPAQAAPRGDGDQKGQSGSLTVDEALKLAFPGCRVKRTTVYLKKPHKKRIAKLAGEKWTKGVVFPYVATKDGKLVGTAYFDAHRVRTLRETVMIVVEPTGKIGRVEVLAFGEPPAYRPRAKWYAQFVGHELNARLRLKRGIQGVSGATLTARATTSAARRTLALHEVLGEMAAERAKQAPAPQKPRAPKKGPPGRGE